MNEQNFEYLKNQLKYHGFGEELNDKLQSMLTSGKPEFTLFHSHMFGKDSAVATLQFRKSDTSDLYFFNRYSMLVKNHLHPDAAKQTFYIHKDQDNVAFKEAYNLMSGRAVFKELTNKDQEKYNAWIQLDFRQTDDNGNFGIKKFNENYYKLEEVLAKYPIRELGIELDRERLIKSLQRGNVQSVTLVHGEKSTSYFIEAAPQFKTINFYDANFKRVMREGLENGAAPALSKEVKQSTGSSADDDEPGSAAKKKNRRNVQHL